MARLSHGDNSCCFTPHLSAKIIPGSAWHVVAAHNLLFGFFAQAAGFETAQGFHSKTEEKALPLLHPA